MYYGHTKIIQSGNFLEVYEYEKDLPTNKKSPKRTRNPYKRDKIFRYRRSDSVSRVRKNFTRSIRANLVGDEKPALFTLTMLEIMGIKQSYGILSVFIRCLRRDFGRDFKYFAVPEFQKRGAVHFHLLIWGLPCEYVENERNNRYFQNTWQAGYVDCLSTDGSPKLAGYLAKYLSKAMSDERLFGEKAFTCSRNTLRSVSLSFKTAYSLSKEMWGIDLSTDEGALQKKEFETQWLGKGRYRIYKIN